MSRHDVRGFIVLAALSAFSCAIHAQVCAEKPDANTSCGANALLTITTGAGNVAMGDEALLNDMTGNYNTAFGYLSLDANITGTYNAGFGAAALQMSQGANANTALGTGALRYDTTGANNTAAGFAALYNNQYGSGNTAVGSNAGSGLVGGNYNTYVGSGVAGTGTESYVTRIGVANPAATTYIEGIRNTPVTGSPVYVSSSGQLGTSPGAAAGGALVVEDSAGTVVGTYIFASPNGSGSSPVEMVFVRSFPVSFLIPFGPAWPQGVSNYSGSPSFSTLYYQSSDCSGTSYSISYSAGLFKFALVGNTTAYLPGAPVSIAVLSSAVTLTPGSPNGPCVPGSYTSPKGTAAPIAATYDLSTLNLIPPYSVH